jgi:hypothetical protein
MFAQQKAFIAVPPAAFGAMLGLASLLGEWSRVVLSDNTTAPAWTLFSHGVYGLSYTLALIAMLTTVVVALFSRHRATSTGLRAAGLVLAAESPTNLAAGSAALRSKRRTAKPASRLMPSATAEPDRSTPGGHIDTTPPPDRCVKRRRRRPIPVERARYRARYREFSVTIGRPCCTDYRLSLVKLGSLSCR